MTTTTTRRYLTIALVTGAQRVVAAPGGIVVALAFYAIVVAILASLWEAAAGANAGVVAGYSAAALTWYVATSEAATVSLNIRTIEEVGDEIASGSVAVEMLRPASVVGIRIAAQVGRALPRLAACSVVGFLIARSLGGPVPNGTALALAAPSLVLAIACNLVAQHAFAGAAFWIRDARSTWFLYQKLVFVIGGMLLPLEVLPSGLEAVAKVLPFMAMAYAPARLAAGYVEPWLLAVQLGWLVVLTAAAIAVFGAGERRLQVVGG
jgi:ABC-2 type transport system permease protein